MEWKCKEGCSECCGVAPIPEDIWNKHKDKAERVIKIIKEERNMLCYVPITKDNKCSLLNLETNKCKIYEDRPLVCKWFGPNPKDIKNLDCPYLTRDGEME